jgi:hypothetical protein
MALDHGHAEAAGRVAPGDGPDDLLAVAEPGVAVAIWRREPCAAFAAWVDSLPLGRMPSLNALLDVTAVGEAVAAACDVAGLPACENRDRLAGDAAALCFALTAATGLRLLRLRLGAVAGGGPFAPADGVAHLVCAYRCAGPEFGLGRDAPGAARLGRLARGEAAILRGPLWPAAETHAVWLRTTPQQGSGLLLAAEPAPNAPQA